MENHRPDAPLPDPQQDVAERARKSARLVLKGVALNGVLVIVKAAGGVFGHTYALIADAVESLLDIVTSLLIWAGLTWAAQPPDQNHPYGHGKAEALAGLVVSLLVFAAAGWVGWHAVEEIRAPHRGPHWGTLPLLIGVVAVKIYYSRRMLRAGRETSSTSLGIEAWHHYADALTSAAAFIGIAIAVIGGPGYESADDWAALLACVVIAWNGVGLARKALDDVMDGAVSRELENRIRAEALSVPGALGIDKCRVRKSGLSHFVDIHVEVEETLTVRAGHDIAGAVKHALLRSALHISDVAVHIEPQEKQR